MTLSANAMTRLKQMLRTNEGKFLYVYSDKTGKRAADPAGGKLTIGYGRNLEAKGISSTEAEMLLNNDINDCIVELNHNIAIFDELNDVRKCALIDMAFNLGIKGLMNFGGMLSQLKQKNYSEAANEMLDSLYARQVGKRAKNNATMMRTGEWNNETAAA